jgi:hypothetical protein
MSYTDPQQASLWVLPAIGAGGIAVATSLVAGHLLYVRTRESDAWVFPALLMAFAVGACALTAIGRVPLGIHSMTASRYIVFTASFWVGLLLLLTVSTPFRSRAGRTAGLLLACLIVGGGLRAWGDSVPCFERHAVTGLLGREALLREDWPKTTAIFPVAPVLDERRQFLMRHRLSLYRPGAQ